MIEIYVMILNVYGQIVDEIEDHYFHDARIIYQ